MCVDIKESCEEEVGKANTVQPVVSEEKPVVSEERPVVKDTSSSVVPATASTSNQSVKVTTVVREESPPPPPPPSTTAMVAMATNNPHYASTSTSYSQSPSAGSEGYSAYLQVRTVLNISATVCDIM